MHRHVNFVLSYPPHLPYLVVALYTLRRHWSGHVVLHAWPESYEICAQIANDQRLYCQVALAKPLFLHKNAQFLQKIRLAQKGQEGTFLYLDADTSIHGRLDPLFWHAEEFGFAATQFCDWTTHTKVRHWTDTKDTTVAGRLERLGEFQCFGPWLNEVLSKPYPSVNGGVFAASAGSPVLDEWLDWADVARNTRTPDETTLHLLQIKFANTMWVLTGRYNRSPVYGRHITDYVINHYHGNSAVRPDKAPEGSAQWMKLFEECRDQNIGGVADWANRCGNKHLNLLMDCAV